MHRRFWPQNHIGALTGTLVIGPTRYVPLGNVILAVLAFRTVFHATLTFPLSHIYSIVRINARIQWCFLSSLVNGGLICAEIIL